MEKDARESSCVLNLTQTFSAVERKKPASDRCGAIRKLQLPTNR